MRNKLKKLLGYFLLHQLMTFLFVLIYMSNGETFVYSYGVSFVLSSFLFGLCVFIALIFVYLID